MPIIIPANSAVSGGFNVANSLRFNSGSSDKLNRSTGVTTTNTKFTLSFWLKLCDVSNFQSIFQTYKSSNERFECGFNLDNSNQPRFVVQEYTGSYIFRKIFSRSFRDTSAWYHFVIKFDSSEAEANRLRVYINGIEETATDTVNLPSSGASSIISVGTQNIGYSQSEDGQYFNGYLAEFVLVEATDYAPTDFGEFDSDSNIWKPIKVSGLTFGTNGFYLEFKGSGTSANASGMGADTSGNTHHFAVNNLTAVDQSTDTCTNNGATWNSLIPPGGGFVANTTVAWSEGNTVATLSNGSGNYGVTLSTIGMTTGKFYCEIKYASSSGGGVIGIRGTQGTNQNNFLGGRIKDFAFQTNGHMVSGAGNDSSYGGTWGNGDIIGIALDLDNNKLYFSKNGTFENSGNPTSGSTGTGAIAITPLSTSGSNDLGAYFFGACEYYNSGNAVFSANFGSPPYAISSGNQDADGFGNFEYAVPSGYFSLNTKNLAEYG